MVARLTISFGFEFDEVWLWLYTISNDLDAVNIYIENLVVYSEKFVDRAEQYAFETSNKQIDLAKLSVDLSGKSVSDVVEITENGDTVTFSKDTANNVITLTSGTYTDDGSVRMVTIDFGDRLIGVPLKCCTLAIYNKADFDSMPSFYDTETHKITGYYLLCADIDYDGGYFEPFCGYKQNGNSSSGNLGWQATFDGNGHIIRNMIHGVSGTQGTWNCGVFGSIGFNGVVKDVAFVDCTSVQNVTGGFFARLYLRNSTKRNL